MKTEPTPTVFLHVGYNKAGSTALQSWFSRNRTALLEQHALLYPRCGLDGGAHYGLSEICGFSPSRQSPAEDVRTRFLDSFRLEATRSGCSRIMFSSEDFVLDQDPARARDLLQDYPVRIVMYLRRHDSWWESAYKQAVTMIRQPAWEPGIEGFIAFNREQNPWYGNYRDFVDRWSRVFGEEQLLVRPYESSQMQGGIVPDMLSALSLNPSLANDESARQRLNPSLDNRATALLDLAQRCDLTDGELQRLLGYLRAHHSKPGEPSLLSPARRRQLIEENSADYEYISRILPDSRSGGLFTDPWPRDEDVWEKPAPLGGTEIIRMLAAAGRA